MDITTDAPDTEQTGWQARKSELMRVKILEATIRSFVKVGYARTTTQEIAKEASVSRGAMVHHFATKEELVKAAIVYLTAKRIENFRAHLAKKSSYGVDPVLAGLDAYWAHLSEPMFAAFQELMTASRTDPALETILVPAVREFEQEWYTTAYQAFPEWQNTGVIFDLAMDLTQFLFEGMILHSVVDSDPARYARMRKYIANRLRKILSMVRSAEPEEAIKKYLAGEE